MARFITSLRSELTASQEDRDKQLAVALGALNANDDNSLISRLMRETHEARKSVMDAVNPNLPGSPMTMLATGLTQMLEAHVQTQSEGLEQQRIQ